MKMDGWRDHLHFELGGEHVLFPGLHLDSAWHFTVAAILTVTLCLFERSLTFAMSQDWCPFLSIRRFRLRKALWKTCLYWIVTLSRLLYMLVAMTNNAGLILVATTSLSIGQFVIHYVDEPLPDIRTRGHRDSENVKEPLLDSPRNFRHSASFPLRNSSVSSIAPPYDYHNDHSPVSTVSSTLQNEYAYTENPYTAEPIPLSDRSESQHPYTTRSRSRSKPADIFIHPAESNLSRADVAAQQLGISGDTDLVQSSRYPPENDIAWEVGTGKDVARELLLGSGSRKNTL